MDTRSSSTPAFAAGLAAVLLAAGCAADLTETADTVTIHGGLGGLLGSDLGGLTVDKWAEYQEIASRGKDVRVAGEVVSADAFLSFGVADACYTDRARVCLHAASYAGVWPAPDVTDWLAEMLPDPLEQAFRAHHSYHDPLGAWCIPADELRRIWPEGECEEGA